MTDATLTPEAVLAAIERLRLHQVPEPCRHALHPADAPRVLSPDRADEAVAVVPCGMLCGHSFLLGPAP